MVESLFLIDGNSLINRAYYALPPLNTLQGEPTNAVYGFSMMLFRLLEDYNPGKIYVAFDVSGPTFRHEAYEEYKANRHGMPDDLRPQIDTLKQVLDVWGINRFELAGYEADDIIGTAAKKGEKAGYHVYIVTGDRDALQLISSRTTVLLTKRGIKEIEVVDEQGLQQKYELKPEQIVDLKGLMGDSSDNIPGIPGVGEKTALKLLKKHASIDQIYQALDQEKGKLKERLLKYRDQAFLSRQLATIDCQAPITIDFEPEKQPDYDQLAEIFQRLEFQSLVERLTVEQGIDPKSAVTKVEIDYDILTQKHITDCKQEISAAKKIAVYIDNQNIGVAYTGKCWFIPTDTTESFFEVLKECTNKVCIYTNDAKKLYKLSGFAGNYQIEIDVSLAGYVLDPAGPLDLTSLATRYTDIASQTEFIDEQQQIVYQASQVWQLAQPLKERMQADKLWDLYTQVELPLAKVLAKMEAKGIICNPARLAELSQQMTATLDRLTAEIHESAGEQFNINSPKQLGNIMFNKLGLPVIKKTKTGPSTDVEVLENLSYHPMVAKILEYRQLNKLKSTYTDALAHLINPKTARIHSTFNQTVTATGRLSSTNPNLQNIPIRTKEGRRIRSAFQPQQDWYLLAADYSQIELRVLAHISQDERMIDAFNSDVDIHKRTASEVFKIPFDQVTQEDRASAKAINFGIVYGISSFGLAKGTNMSRAKAQQYIDQYFSRYPKVKAYLDRVVEEAKTKGYVTTLFNRRRYLPDIMSRNYQRRTFAERMAMNTPIQGSAADIIKIAMLKVDQALDNSKLKAQMLLQVHDELVLEVPKQELSTVVDLVKKNMETAIDMVVDLKVDIKVGNDWENVRPLDEVK